MTKKALITFLLFALLGAMVAFLGAVAFFSTDREEEVPPQAWRAPVENILPMSTNPAPILDRLLDLSNKRTMCLPTSTGCVLPPEEVAPSSEPPSAPFVPLPEPPLPEGKKQPGFPIAIIIDDVGLSFQATARTIALPASVTLSFLPFAERLQEQVNAARKAGHEIMLHMPMEPRGKLYPGPNALLTSLDDEEIKRRIVRNLNAFDGYVGLNNHMGSRFTTDRRRMELFFDSLVENKGKSLFFVDSRTFYTSVAAAEAQRAGIRAAIRDVFLDDKIELKAIEGELARLEETAKHNGFAIAIGHPHDLTLQVLEAWIPTLETRGLRLVPVEQLVR